LEASYDTNDDGGIPRDPILVFQCSESRLCRCLAHHYYSAFSLIQPNHQRAIQTEQCCNLRRAQQATNQIGRTKGIQRLSTQWKQNGPIRARRVKAEEFQTIRRTIFSFLGGFDPIDQEKERRGGK